LLACYGGIMYKKFLQVLIVTFLLLIVSGCKETKKYIISFESNGGSIIEPIMVEENAVLNSLEAPEKKGFKFDGWYLDAELSEKFITASSSNPVESDLILYAKWIAPYKVIFYNDDNTINKTEDVFPGEKVEFVDYEKADSIRYSYEFKGWYLDRELKEEYDFNQAVDKTFYLYPKFDKIEKKVDFKGMTVSFLGDSITTYYADDSPVNSYYSGDNEFYYPRYSATVKAVEDTWWYQLSKLAELKIGINNSLSGSSVSSEVNGGMAHSRINTLGENGTPDIIFIHLGTNDNVNGLTPTMFKNNYRIMLERIQRAYPDSIIFAATLGYSAYTGYNYTEKNRLEYNKAIREIAIEKDIYIFAIDQVQTKETYLNFLGDNLHPNAKGMKGYAEKAHEALIKELG